MRKAYNDKNAVAVGPYSHAVEANGSVYLSGQTPMQAGSTRLIEGDLAMQTEQCFKNLFAILAGMGLSEKDVVKVKVFLTDMNDFTAMNEVYKKQFSQPYPARTTIGVASLPLGAEIEIELIAKAKN